MLTSGCLTSQPDYLRVVAINPGDIKMSCRALTLTLVGSILAISAPLHARAEDPLSHAIDSLRGNHDYHLEQAISHTQEAIYHGESGHAHQLSQHAREALMNADAQYYGDKNPHVSEAAKHLKSVIKHGDMGHARIGVSHANEALVHLKASM